MELYIDCIPCMINHVSMTIQRLELNEARKLEVIKGVIKTIHENMCFESCAPKVMDKCYQFMKKELGIEDFYKEEKTYYNKMIMDMEEDFRKVIKDSENPIEKALLLSGAANAIDFGVLSNVDRGFIQQKIKESVKSRNIKSDIDIFMKELSESRSILYIGDNCGEIALDKLAIQTIKTVYPDINITYVVREVPVLNDVTMHDAYEVGMHECCNVISNGSSAPGTIVHECSDEFRHLYYSSDIKILKGMGNTETAIEGEEDAYYIFMCKCNLMSSKLKLNLYDICFTKGNPLYTK